MIEWLLARTPSTLHRGIRVNFKVNDSMYWKRMKTMTKSNHIAWSCSEISDIELEATNLNFTFNIYLLRSMVPRANKAKRTSVLLSHIEVLPVLESCFHTNWKYQLHVFIPISLSHCFHYNAFYSLSPVPKRIADVFSLRPVLT